MANILNIYDKDKGKYVSIPSIQGESAYDIAVKHGFDGTEEEWAKTLSSGQTTKVYKYALEVENYDDQDFVNKRKLNFDLPVLPTYEGGTRFYCEPVPIVPGETDFYSETTVLAGKKEIGYETDDTYKTKGKYYINSSYEGFEDNKYVTMHNTKSGLIEDYMVRSYVREKYRNIDDMAMLLTYKYHNDYYGYWMLSNDPNGSGYCAWVYPVEYFEPCVNGVYQAVDIKLISHDSGINFHNMFILTKEDYMKLCQPSIYGKYEGILGGEERNWQISTEGNTTDAYVMVLYDNYRAEDDYGWNGNRLNPHFRYTLHSCAYDYINYKVWTTNIDGSEASAKYTLGLDEPLVKGEYMRFATEPFYSKHSKVLYNKEEFVSLYGYERFTGEYDSDSNPIFTKTLFIEAPEKSSKTTINRYKNSVDYGIKGLIKFHEITPTWRRSITNSMSTHVYTGNCFAVDEYANNFGVYQTSNNGLDSVSLSWNYLQVYPTETSIVADRGCNVWCYDCDVVLRYTRKLTEEDYDKYHIS